jgi:hypothetical protein
MKGSTGTTNSAIQRTWQRNWRRLWQGIWPKAAIAAVAMLAAAGIAIASGIFGPIGTFFFPGNLVVSRSVYSNNASAVTVGEILPPNCANTTGGCGASTGAQREAGRLLQERNEGRDFAAVGEEFEAEMRFEKVVFDADTDFGANEK